MLYRFRINYFLFFATIAVIGPYLQVILKVKGFSPSSIGLLLGFYEVTGVAGPLIAGWLAERIEKYRLLMLIFAFLTGGIFFLFGLSRGFLWSGAALILFGLFYRPIPSLQDALSSRTLHNPIKSYGGVRIWGSVGFIAMSLGIQFTGFLKGSSSGRIVFIFIIFAFLLFLSTLLLPEIKRIPEETGGLKKDPKFHPLGMNKREKLLSGIPAPFWLALVTAFFIKMGITGHYSFFSLFMRESYSVSNVSGIWAIGAFAEIPMILWGSRFVERFGTKAMLVLAVLGASLRLLLYAAELPLPVILTAQLLHAFSFGLIHITMISVINHTVPPRRRAFAMSLYGGIGFGLAGFIGSSIGGYILEGFGFRALYLFCGSVTLLPLIPLNLLKKSAVI